MRLIPAMSEGEIVFVALMVAIGVGALVAAAVFWWEDRRVKRSGMSPPGEQEWHQFTAWLHEQEGAEL